jgi:hypothetical protein
VLTLEGGRRVSWQEDLRLLDQELAMGRLSAEDYRRRRDDLLAAANTGFAAPQPSQPSQPAPPSSTSPPSPPSGTPFPPAFRWTAQQPPASPTPQPPPASPSESTQIMRPVGEDGPPPSPGDATQVVQRSEQTQVVSGNQQQPGEGERTQVVRAPGQGGAPYSQQPWQAGGDRPDLYNQGPIDNSPSWATGGTFSDWPRQGPEVFNSTRSNGRGRRILLIALAVVVLAGVGVGVWLLVGNHSNTASSTQGGGAQTTTAPPRPTSQPPKAAIGSLVQAPGIPQTQSFTPAQIAAQKPLATPDLDILAASTYTKADYVVSRDGTTVLDLWGFTTPDSASATSLAQKLDTDQVRFGFQPTDIKAGGGRYTAYSSQQQSSGQTVVAYRMHYVVGNQVIRIETFDASGTTARQEFEKLLALQTKLTPPTT